jgi:uncharacterized membrane protein YjjP (DUF1212 family)
MESNTLTRSEEFGSIFLDLGVLLLKSGESCNRIRSTMVRFTSAYHYVPHITIGPKSVSLTLHDKTSNSVFSGSRSTPAQGVDFKIISAINKLSWAIVKEILPLDELKSEVNKLSDTKHYPRIVTLCCVSLAGAAFCYTFGGSILEMMITFGATFCGLFTKQQLLKYVINPYICTYLAALVSTFFIGLFYIAGVTLKLENAFSTCVLFLIPGVPLINGFTDLIDGNILNGVVKGVNALLFALAIALGLLTTMVIFNFNG